MLCCISFFLLSMAGALGTVLSRQNRNGAIIANACRLTTFLLLSGGYLGNLTNNSLHWLLGGLAMTGLALLIPVIRRNEWQGIGFLAASLGSLLLFTILHK